MNRLWTWVIAALIVASFVSLVLFDVPLIGWLELKSLDWRFQQRGATEATGDVVVVAIDEKSLHSVGRWPWPRDKIARLLAEINKAEPDVVEMDIVFAETATEDSTLANVIGQTEDMILGYYFYQDQKEVEAAEIAVEKIEASYLSILPAAFPRISDLHEELPEMQAVVSNTDIFAKAADSQGYFNAFPDSDGVIRRFPIMASYRGKIFPSLALETFSHYQHHFDPVPVRDEAGVLQGISVGQRFIPTGSDGDILINYRGGAQAFQILSAADVLAGKAPTDALRDKTVLIGATAVGIYDMRVTPISANFPGVLVQANLIDNLYKGDFLIENLGTRLWSLGIMIVLTILLVVILPRLPILLGLLFTAVILAAYSLLTHWAFSKGVVLTLVTPSFEMMSLFITFTIYRGLTEEREKRMIRDAFQAYLHPDLVREMTLHIKTLKLGGDKVDCTILFVDVRNFTALSENMEPEQVVELMNSYFGPVTKVIVEEGGYIDKFIGDAVMAIFGAPQPIPDHAAQACRAALAIQTTARELESQFQLKYNLPSFRIGIGLHSGPAVVGNIGTRERLNYTVMGDTVNLASRLEGANKLLHTTILISEETNRRVSNQFETRYVDTIPIKGKKDKIRVYELLRPKD